MEAKPVEKKDLKEKVEAAKAVKQKALDEKKIIKK